MEPIPAPAIDLISLAPVLVLSVFGMMVLVTDLFIGKDKSILVFMSLIGLLMAAISSLAKYNLPVFSFNGAYVVDHLSVFFTFIFCISSALAILLSVDFNKREGIKVGEYYSLILFCTVGMVLLASSTDMIMIFLGIEVVSISLYILAGIQRKNTKSNEAALKLARRWALDVHGSDKTQIIAFKQGFHGRTFFTVTVGGQPAYSDGFGPKPGDIVHAEYNNLDSVKALISDKTCAIMIEPLQGEGGIVSPTDEFIKGVRELCNEHNALLIFDEVQTGAGRLGPLYAYMDLGVTPDILTSAKGLGGGIPIGAMLTTTYIAKHLKIGTHGSTYGGNPLACAVSEAVIDVINTPEVQNGVKAKAQLYVDGLNTINAKYDVFKEIRGKGLLIGAVLNDKYQGKAKDFLVAAMSEGVMTLVAGASIVRFAPSLVIPDEDIIEGLARFEKAVAKIAS